MSIKYVSGTIFYNDCKSLERCLASLHDKVDVMCCVDGRFKHFKDNNSSSLSNDGSREVVESYDNAILIDVPDSYEIQKRTAYIDYCVRINAEYLLIIDSDEYVYEPESNWNKFDAKVNEMCNSISYINYNIFGIYTEVKSPDYDHIVHKIVGSVPPDLTRSKGPEGQPPQKAWSYHPRLWHRPYDMEYNQTHYMFRNKNPKNPLHTQEHNATVAIIPHLKLGHDHIYRTKEFLQSRFDYQKWLVKFEQKKLKRWMELYHRLPENYDEIDLWEPPSAEEAIKQGLVKIR